MSLSVGPEGVPLSAQSSQSQLRWRLSLYPQALEGGGCFVPTIQPVREYVARGAASDPQRSALEAGRRARARLRRYCAANRLNRLGTLTYAGEGCHDVDQLRDDVAIFFRNLRTGLGGAPLPYVWVPEWHKSGHGLHVHFAVGKFVKRQLVDESWGHGFVHIKLLGDLGVGSGALEEARKAAGYLSKYVAKTFTTAEARILGRHRYEVAQGFQPTKLWLWDKSPESLIEQASKTLDSPLTKVWNSELDPDWQGAPAIWAQWGAR